MSKRSRSRVGVSVRPVPLPKVLVRAQAAGEMVDACGGTEEEVDIAQRGIARGLLSEVMVYGVDSSGVARDQVMVEVKDKGEGDIELDLDGGKRSAVEALDGSLARAIGEAAERIRSKGLRPEVRFVLQSELDDDAARADAAREELGIEPCEELSWGNGREGCEITRIHPGKDPGLVLRVFRGFKMG